MASSPLMTTTALLPPTLPLVASGKVRDLYSIDQDTLLFVATDRISAFDVVLANGIPGKGRLLTLMTARWIHLIHERLPSIKTHFISLDLPPTIPAPLHATLQDSAMVVRRCKVLPIEAIVRKYLCGSSFTEYQRHGTVHGTPMPPGLRESEALPGGPYFTPSTKAPPGEHDVNIPPEKARELIGEVYAKRVEEMALSIFNMASQYAEERGLIIADTKFEFGVDEQGEVVLIDEIITPDSSRFFDKEKYVIGKANDSFDKEYARQWLIREGLKGKADVTLPQEVVEATMDKYQEAYERLVDKPLKARGK